MSVSSTIVRCTFCGQRGPRSREDVIPIWLAKELGGEPPFFASAQHYQDYKLVRTSKDRKVGSAAAYKLQEVCLTCNNGWMHDLEDASIPLLVPLIRGELGTQMDRQAQETIAVWLTKTLLAFDAYQTERHIPEAAGTRSFYDSREPASHVLLGAFLPVPEGTAIPHSRRRIRLRTVTGDFLNDDSIRFTIAFKHLLMQGLFVVNGFEGEGETERLIPNESAPLFRIWPTSSEIAWLPTAAFDLRSFATIA